MTCERCKQALSCHPRVEVTAKQTGTAHPAPNTIIWRLCLTCYREFLQWVDAWKEVL